MRLKFSLKQDGGIWRVDRVKRDYPEPSLAISTDTVHLVWIIGETMFSFRGCRWPWTLQKRDIMAFYDGVVKGLEPMYKKSLC